MKPAPGSRRDRDLVMRQLAMASIDTQVNDFGKNFDSMASHESLAASLLGSRPLQPIGLEDQPQPSWHHV